MIVSAGASKLISEFNKYHYPMDTDRIAPQQWMIVPRETRERLVSVFNIGKSGITEVHNENVVTDGRTVDDLRAITSDVMAEYVGSSASFFRLWELSIAKAYSELHSPVGMVGKPGTVVPVVVIQSLIDSADQILADAEKARKENVRQTRLANLARGRMVAKSKKMAAAQAEARASGVHNA